MAQHSAVDEKRRLLKKTRGNLPALQKRRLPRKDCSTSGCTLSQTSDLDRPNRLLIPLASLVAHASHANTVRSDSVAVGPLPPAGRLLASERARRDHMEAHHAGASGPERRSVKGSGNGAKRQSWGINTKETADRLAKQWHALTERNRSVMDMAGR